MGCAVFLKRGNLCRVASFNILTHYYAFMMQLSDLVLLAVLPLVLIADKCLPPVMQEQVFTRN
jgi:hypothetical protein